MSASWEKAELGELGIVLDFLRAKELAQADKNGRLFRGIQRMFGSDVWEAARIFLSWRWGAFSPHMVSRNRAFLCLSL